jgi:NADH-ubiquinone oxidoreductase chain 2
LLRYVWGISPVLIVLVCLSTYVGRVGGLNQSSLRKLIAYSSINHLGWLMVALYFGLKFILIYFLIYMITNWGLILGLRTSGFYYLSQVYYYSGSQIRSIVVLVNWLSFGGLPPFIGFFGKWLLISLMVDRGIMVLCLFMVFISLVSLFYYTRICYAILSQSGSAPVVTSKSWVNTWWLNFLVIRLVGGLLLAPIFVIWL